jgi:signal transduction histidine kinase
MVLSGMLVLALGSSAFAVTKVQSSQLTAREMPVAPPQPFPGERFDPPPPPPDRFPDERSWAIAWNDLPGLTLMLIAAWAIGSGTRSRRAYLVTLRARAVDLEREQGQRAVLAVAAERGRISRELHDVVAHGLSVMVIQAQGGAAALDNRPADTRAALEAIVKTGRDSLADMRRVLGTVGEVDDAWHPQPGLPRLPALLSQVREAGTPVRLRIEGAPLQLPSAVDLTAYRIVQEALTNTMNHASAGASAQVVVTYAESAVHIEVSDDGIGAGHDDGCGNGLRGMRERVKLLGGRLDAGPGPQGGFFVRVTLPIGEHHS